MGERIGNYEEEVREARWGGALAFFCIIVVTIVGFASYFLVHLQPEETAVTYITLIGSTSATCIALATLVYSSYSANLERREQGKTRQQQADESARAAADALYIALETNLVVSISNTIHQYKDARNFTPKGTLTEIENLRKTFEEMDTLSQVLDIDYSRYIQKFTLQYPEATQSVFYLLSTIASIKPLHSISIDRINSQVERLREAHAAYEALKTSDPSRPIEKKSLDIHISVTHNRIARALANLIYPVIVMCRSLELIRLIEPISIERSDALNDAIALSGTSKTQSDESFVEEGMEILEEEVDDYLETTMVSIKTGIKSLPTTYSI